LPEQMKIFANLLEKHGYRYQDYKMVFREGDVQSVIWDVCHEEQVDLLVSGALRKESPERQYFGSIARGLAGNPKGPIMLIPEPSIPARPIEKIIAPIPASNPGPMIEAGLYFARQTGRQTIYFVKESIFNIDPLISSDYGELEGFNEASLTIVDLEYAQIHQALKTYDIAGLDIKVKVVFGLPGSGIVSFAKEIGADLIIDSLSVSQKNDNDFGYPRDIEVILMNLPCNFLLFN
jgi:nucleotide-binding universal stress UspA family protein